jgi:hypothetical protein
MLCHRFLPDRTPDYLAELGMETLMNQLFLRALSRTSDYLV